MRIGIDASCACGKRTGTGNYTMDLVRSLTAADNENEYYLYFRSCCVDSNPLYAITDANVHRRIVDSRFTLFRILIRLSFAISRDRIDVYVSPAFFLPLFGSKKFIVTFFDLNIYRLPEHWWRSGRKLDFLAMRILLPLSARSADHIVALSSSTQKDLTTLFPSTEKKSSVIYCGIDHAKFENALRSADANIVPAPKSPFFLYVGVMSPTKNLVRILRAFHQFKQTDTRNSSLVLAGKECGQHMTDVLSPLIATLGLEKYVVWRGFVRDAELAQLYQKACALVCPSLCEGFGYPIAEAMYMGLPVITSNTSSCPEIAGDAALCVDPSSVEAISDAMVRVSMDRCLCDLLVAKGHTRCNMFTLEAMATQYSQLLAKIHGKAV